jgi:hypothetical protein
LQIRQQSFEEAARSLGVASGLNKDVEHDASDTVDSEFSAASVRHRNHIWLRVSATSDR